MRRFLLGLGLTVVTVAAVVASFSTLASLAVFTGWGERSSWLLPLALDALGMTACLVWLDPTAPKEARRYAAWMTWVAAGLSVLGNGAGHLAATGHLSQGLLLVVLVGSVPPAALTVTVHLIVSVKTSPPEVKVQGKVEGKPQVEGKPAPDAAPVPVKKAAPAPVKVTAPALPSGQGKPRSAPQVEGRAEGKVDEVELQRARHADREYRASHEGKPIGRVALKAALGIGTDKAQALLAALKKEEEAA
ncbi:DUF2637 domain-containing protein [Kribbella qitaiheensis]|uniref:DUF2637 domain-containing protein n=1 Tax=Kribbella qitaiheensis TaxID=1544730 RepID=UPI003619CF4D